MTSLKRFRAHRDKAKTKSKAKESEQGGGSARGAQHHRLDHPPINSKTGWRAARNGQVRDSSQAYPILD